MQGPDGVAHRIRIAEFALVRRGLNVVEVDDYLEAVAQQVAAFEAGPDALAPSPDVLGRSYPALAQLRTRRFAKGLKGYRAEDVQRLLGEVADHLHLPA